MLKTEIEILLNIFFKTGVSLQNPELKKKEKHIKYSVVKYNMLLHIYQ